MADEIIRAFELPVNAVEDVEGGLALVGECWRQATLLSNWCAQTLLRHDVLVTPGMKELPPMPEIDLYALAFGRAAAKRPRKGAKRSTPLPPVVGTYDGSFFVGAKQSAASIMNAVRRKYAAERREVLWRRRRSAETYKDPQPWPVANAAWHAVGLDNQHRPWVTVSLPGGRVTLRLRGGHEFGRQMAHFRTMAQGGMPRKGMVLLANRCGEDRRRAGVTVGGVHYRVMCKMVAGFPAREASGGRTLVLATDPNAFWVAELDGRQAWVLNGDLARRLTGEHAAHLARLQRLSQDRKAERRLADLSGKKARRRARRKRRHDAGHADALACRARNRMASWTHEAAANLAGFCGRNGVAAVLYLDGDRCFMPRFPWHELHNKLAQKLQERGVALYCETGQEVPPPDAGGEPFVINVRPTNGVEDEKWGRVTALREQAARKVLTARSRRSRSTSHPAVSAP